MGLLKWLENLAGANVERRTQGIEPVHAWPPPSTRERKDGSSEEDDFGVRVVGESHYQETLQNLSASGIEVFKAVLVPESDNPHDEKAVRVIISGSTVGYLSRDDARAFRRRLARKKLGEAPTSCEAHLNGRKTFGVELAIKHFE